MTPLVMGEGERTILVNRGWIPNSIALVPTFFATEEEASAYAATASSTSGGGGGGVGKSERALSPVVTLEAIVDKGEAKQTFVPDNATTAPLRRYFWLDLPAMAAAAGAGTSAWGVGVAVRGERKKERKEERKKERENERKEFPDLVPSQTRPNLACS